MNEFERTYFTNQIATELNMGKSTVSKWARELEKEGYEFIKDESDNRVYTESDMLAFRFLKQLSTETNMTLKECCQTVSSKYARNKNITRESEYVANETGTIAPLATSPTPFTKEDFLTIIRQHTEQQSNELKRLSEKVESLETDLRNREEREREKIELRDRTLMNMAEEMVKIRKEIAAANEEKEQKKWFQFWK